MRAAAGAPAWNADQVDLMAGGAALCWGGPPVLQTIVLQHRAAFTQSLSGLLKDGDHQTFRVSVVLDSRKLDSDTVLNSGGLQVALKLPHPFSRTTIEQLYHQKQKFDPKFLGRISDF